VVSSTVLVDHAELFFTPAINKKYFALLTTYVTASSSGDMKQAFTIPTGASGNILTGAQYMAALDEQAAVITTTAPLGVNAAGLVEYSFPIKIQMGATPGNIQYQFAQNTSNATPTIIKAGTTLLVWEE